MNKVHQFLQRLQAYFSLNGYLVPQDQAEASIREGINFRGTNLLILIFAIIIASLGLNTNSAAVIIGAMLISPLMGPIIGIGLGIGIEDFELIKRSLRNLTVAAGFSVIASAIYFFISPVTEGHSELLARTSPTIYDVLVGLFGGAAGIFAIASKSKGNVIPGVAIATALMPPLCTAGYGLATWQWSYFFGAFYLFLINSIYIATATFIGVKVMHFQRAQTAVPERAKRLRRVVYTIAVLTLLPSIYLTYNMLRNERFAVNAERFVTQECRFPATHVLSQSVTDADGHRTINITLIGKVLPQDSLELALSSRLQYYGLQGAALNIVQGESLDASAIDQGHSVRQIYELAQSTLLERQHTIDSLQAIIGNQRANDSIAARIMPELRIIFPQVREIAVSRAVFGQAEPRDTVATNVPLDTTYIALVDFTQPLPPARRQELSDYLKARLTLPCAPRLVDYRP